MPVQTPTWAWIDGRFVPWDQCVVHGRSQAVGSGGSVFEGLRAYWNPRTGQLHVFRLYDHFHRLAQSMKIMRMTARIPPDLPEISVELLRRNEFKEDVHYLPVAYVGMGEDFGIQTKPVHEGFFITATGKPESPALRNGLSACVSSWRRLSDDVMPPRVKATANYQNSRFALLEARANGYDYAIFLNSAGKVSEGPGACVFMVRDGQVCTPSITGGILESITRATLIQLFRERLNVQVVERDIDRTELYLAEELFFCGTGSEVTPIVDVDRIAVGSGTPGKLTQEIQKIYFAIARGDDPSHPEWRTPVYAGAAAGVAARS